MNTDKHHIGDAFLYMDRVFDSCKTLDQYKSFMNLVDNFRKMYHYDIRAHSAYANKFNDMVNRTRHMCSTLSNTPESFEFVCK